MKRHMDKARAQLGDLASLASKTEEAERKILKRAEDRLDEVNGELDKLSAGIEGAADAKQDQYLDLVKERGQLHAVIAKAKTSLWQ